MTAGLSLLLAIGIASLAHSPLLLPLLPMVVLLAIAGVIRILISKLLSDATDSEVPAVVVGMSALVFGWFFGVWMLWMIPARVKLLPPFPVSVWL